MPQETKKQSRFDLMERKHSAEMSELYMEVKRMTSVNDLLFETLLNQCELDEVNEFDVRDKMDSYIPLTGKYHLEKETKKVVRMNMILQDWKFLKKDVSVIGNDPIAVFENTEGVQEIFPIEANDNLHTLFGKLRSRVIELKELKESKQNDNQQQ